MGSKIMIGFLGLSTVVVTFLATRLYRDLLISYEQSSPAHEYSWFFHLLLNMAGYSTILLPGFVIYKYIQKTNYFDKLSSPGCLSRSLFAIFGDPGERLPTTDAPKIEDSPRREAAELALCFSGLMTAYLVWGLLQEKIMTQTYTMSDGSTVKFNDSQLLVFINRLLAFCIAVGRLLWTRTPLFPVPLYQFSYCSLSNIVSAWCQYEALKYVSFPMQVLSKSCKVIPVMLMGKAVSGNKYELYEYVTAAMISLGMVLFMLASKDEYAAGTFSLASGVTLLALYMCCDSFTSSWQARLFARTRAAPLHMVGGVNLFSALLTAAALLQQTPATAVNPRWSLLQHPQFATDVVLLSVSSALGQLLIYRTIARFGAVVFTIIMTLRQHPQFATDVVLLSVSSALGQLLIYRTNSRFGAVVFTIIMTLRQAVSILLSCLVYGHRLSFAGVVGVCVVFTAIFLRVYCRQRLRRRRGAST